MCKACAGRDWGLIDSFWNEGLALPAHSYVSGRGSFVSARVADTPKWTDAFPPPDGVGDVKPVTGLEPAGLIGAGPDDAPNAIGPGVPTVTVYPIGTAMSPATRTVGTLELNADQDYRQVTLEAGKTYEIHMYGLAGGPNAVALADAYIELYGAAGNFITAADGGAMTPANEVNSGFDVLLTFTAEVSGTYYINSRAFDNVPEDGPGGEGVGDYELFVREADPNAPGTYRAYYDLDNPLHAIDWGSRLINKIHQTVRNPDGDEGTRNTGNAQGTPGPYTGPNQGVSTGNPSGFPNAPATYDDPLVDADNDGNGIGDPTPITFTVPGKNVITVYFAKQGGDVQIRRSVAARPDRDRAGRRPQHLRNRLDEKRARRLFGCRGYRLY